MPETWRVSKTVKGLLAASSLCRRMALLASQSRKINVRSRDQSVSPARFVGILMEVFRPSRRLSRLFRKNFRRTRKITMSQALNHFLPPNQSTRQGHNYVSYIHYVLNH